MRTSPPPALTRQQIVRAARHAQHVAERAEDHAGRDGDLDGLVDQLERRDADRTARAVHERDLWRQQLVDAELDDRVGLPAADFHERPRPRRDAPHGPRVAAPRRPASRYSSMYFMTARLRSSSASSPISSRYSNTCRRLVSSTVRDREADVDEHVVADARLGHVAQVHLLDDAGKVDSAAAQQGRRRRS